MLGHKQEALLEGLRTQLNVLAAAGILSPQQLSELRKLDQLHSMSTRMNETTLPLLDAAFEREAPVAFPHPVTDVHAKIIPLDDCRRAIGLHPDCLAANNNGVFLPGSSFRFGDVLSSSEVPVNGMSSWDFASASFGVDSPSQLPSLFNIVAQPTAPDAIVTFIQKLQGEMCAQCNRKLERTRLGLGPYKARWCHESNQFCCEACNNGTCRCVLPAYAILRWDFEPKVCRNAYGPDAEMNYQKPLLCPGAENPQMFDQVPLMQDLRRLRLQLSKLYDIGSSCPRFAAALEDEPERPVLRSAGVSGSGSGGAAAAAASAAQGQRRATFFVAERQRYLVQESEMWSLADLETVYAAVPKRIVPQGEVVPFASFLQSIRDSMIRHVLTECEQCKLNAAHLCLGCGTEPHIYSFDVRNCVECSRCRAVFHRRCWEHILKSEQSCPGCAENQKARSQ